jgi:two-component system chemotaxis response regulator CheB
MIRVVIAEASIGESDRLVRILEADRDIEVVGRAVRASEAIEIVQAETPDVLVLDLQLAAGIGPNVVEQVMAFTPLPILVLSATEAGPDSKAAVEALLAGAVDALPRPGIADPESDRRLRDRVRLVRGVTVVRHPRGRLSDRRQANARPQPPSTATPIVAIGASTGGPAALASVLSSLGGLQAAVLVVQHLHPDFVDGFVSWMARVSALPVEVAVHGSRPRSGVVTIAPGGTHLRLDRTDRFELATHPESLHRPSVNELFTSVAGRTRGAKVGVLLTGIGDDGAIGLLEIRKRGGGTIAQDEGSSAVYGMPDAARRIGAVDRPIPLSAIPAAILRAVV